MGLFSARERLGEFFLAWRQQAITWHTVPSALSQHQQLHLQSRLRNIVVLVIVFVQVRQSLLLEVRLLRETLREAQGDIERCRYFSSEMTRREAEITQRADAKVQQ